MRVRENDPERITCPKCGARIRLRRTTTAVQPRDETGDGYLRFLCPCGRRLKVDARDRPTAGKCPDCGRIVPVPESAWKEAAGASPDLRGQGQTHPAARTEDMDAADLERLERWAKRHQATSNHNQQSGSESTTSHQALSAVSPAAMAQDSSSPVMKMEAGLRVCARCGKPLHMSATVCRSCGEPVPKR